MRRLALEEVGSTNSVALDAARAGDPGPLWVTAERQSAGRGRRGRAWVSESGNLHASLLLIDPAPPPALANLPLVAALGVRDGLASLPGIEPDAVAIKWPNDVLIDGAKAVGILLESERLADGRQAVVIGCGVNVEHGPAEAPYPVATLRSAGTSASLDVVFRAVGTGMRQALESWASGRHFPDIRRRWLDHARGLGEPCRVNLPDGTAVSGIFRTLDADGHLLLETPDGTLRPFSAGDLFLLPTRPRAATATRDDPRADGPNRNELQEPQGQN